jgi:lipopolysaccharide assembly LptE-like protein
VTERHHHGCHGYERRSLEWSVPSVCFRVVCSSVCLLALVGSGCGYTLAGRGSFLPASIKTIGIPTFTNHTTVFNLETLITQKVRSEFIGRGKYQILPQDSGVDAVLIGDIAVVSVTPASFNLQQLASRYAITVTANIQLRDVRENKVLWENPSLIFRQEYEAASGTSPADPNAFFGQEATALDRVSTEFSRAIVSAILEAF